MENVQRIWKYMNNVSKYAQILYKKCTTSKITELKSDVNYESLKVILFK